MEPGKVKQAQAEAERQLKYLEWQMFSAKRREAGSEAFWSVLRATVRRDCEAWNQECPPEGGDGIAFHVGGAAGGNARARFLGRAPQPAKAGAGPRPTFAVARP